METLNLRNEIQSLSPASGPDLAGLRRDAVGNADPAEIGMRFEQIFLQQLVKEMSNSLENGFYGESSGSHVYQGLFEGFIAEKMAESGTLGIAPQVRKFMEKQSAAYRPEQLFTDEPERLAQRLEGVA